VRVLVVDDLAAVRLAAVRELRVVFEVLQAASHAEAMAVLEGHQVDGVVADLNLGPGPTGLDLLRQVRERWPAAVRILMSGNDNAAIDAALADGTVATFLEKPWEPGAIKAALRRALQI
jgi:two-component system, NtrC family, response regulator HupR/HoxA